MNAESQQPQERPEPSTISLILDFRNQPRELCDGLEPTTLIFHPKSFGHPDFEPVDLVTACSIRPESNLPSEIQRELQSVAPPRVRAFDKSSSRWESLLGYYAMSRSSKSSALLVILFSFFEVSPARFHAYLHVVAKISSTSARCK